MLRQIDCCFVALTYAMRGEGWVGLQTTRIRLRGVVRFGLGVEGIGWAVAVPQEENFLDRHDDGLKQELRRIVMMNRDHWSWQVQREREVSVEDDRLVVPLQSVRQDKT